MLKIFCGDMPKAIYNTAIYFNNKYKEHWLLDPLAQEMIKSIDKSTVLDGKMIDSPFLGLIPPTGLSGGVKTLILIQNEPKTVFNASTCCDKCAKWLLTLAKDRDITINLNHLMDFGKDFEVYIINEKKMVNNMLDFVLTAGKYV